MPPTEQPREPIRSRTRHEAEELAQKLTAEISLMLLVLGGIATCLFPADSPRLWGRFAVLLSLLVEGLVAYFLRTRAPRVARAVLLLGPTLSLARAFRVVGGPSLPYSAVLIVVASFAIGPIEGFLAAALNTLSLVILLPWSQASTPLVLIWSASVIEWRLFRELLTALEWSENSQQRAIRLLSELRERQGQLNRTLMALTEATRRLERVNQELAVARRHADEARAAKEQFVANVSHELRTPLNLIVGFAEMMYLAPETYEGVRWTAELESDVGRLYRAARHLQSLVDDILDLSRIDASRLPMFRELQDVRPVIAEALETLAPLLEQRGLWHRAEWADPLPPVYVDRTRIRQVLLNLLNNAARFTDTGGITVRAELAADGLGLVVSVQDTGIGLPAEQLGHIFEVFHQVDASSRRRGGAGLGLAVSRQFVELHGGRMWVESELGEGSTFHFSLPLPGTATQTAALHYTPAGGRDEVVASPVVVVDPDPGIADMLSRYLGDRPLLSARDEAQAEALIEAEHPLAVIVNEMPLPAADGWRGALGQAGARFNVPVFRCSIPSPSWLSRSGGFAACLSKPVSLATLRPVLEQHCPEPGTILVVDDDPGFVSLMGRMLRFAGLAREVLSAYTGQEAVRLARERAPRLVLLDLLMPEMDGFDVLSALREAPGLAGMAVVAVTATSYAEEAVSRSGGRFVLTQARGISTGTLAELLDGALRVVRPSYVAEDSTPSST